MIERRIEMIVFNIDVMMAKRKMTLTELSEKVGITMANLSILKTGKARAVRVDTLNRLCAALNCQPGDLLEWRED
jgi:putative transcriptional regulator